MSQAGMINTAGGPSPPTTLQQFTFDDGTHAIVSANNINVNSGSGVTVTANPDTSSSFIISVINDGFPWSDQAVSFAAQKQNGYFCTAALTVTLPTAGLVTGSTIIIYVDTVAPVVIQAAGGHAIEISQTISVANGTATSTAQGNIVILVFRISDLTWHAISSQGTFTIV